MEGASMMVEAYNGGFPHDDPPEMKVTDEDLDRPNSDGHSPTNEDEINVVLSPDDFQVFQDLDDEIVFIPEERSPDHRVVRLESQPVYYDDAEWMARRDELVAELTDLIERNKQETTAPDTTIIAAEDLDPDSIDISGLEIDTDRAIELEAEAIPELYRDIEYDSGISSIDSPKQIAPLSCTVAVTDYARTILAGAQKGEASLHDLLMHTRDRLEGTLVLDDDAEEVARRMAGLDKSASDIEVPIGQYHALSTIIAQKILRTQYFYTESVTNTLSVIGALETGGVVLFDVGGHARLIESVQIDHGQVGFSVLDPLGSSGVAEIWDMDQISRGIIRLSDKDNHNVEKSCNFFAVHGPEKLGLMMEKRNG